MILFEVVKREVNTLRRVPIYWFCMVVFPILVTVFFTSLMGEGQPKNMPIGVVDLDNSSMSRRLIRTLDNFQSCKVVARYPSSEEARHAIQRNEIYGYMYISDGMSSDLQSGKQPAVSFYYSLTTLAAGSMIYRDMKTAALLASASVGNAKLTARGATEKQAKAFLQPIVIKQHPLSNPWIDYNVYITTMVVPGIFMLFIFLISAYSLGSELKFERSRQWLEMADGNMFLALAGKMLPQTLIFLLVTYGYMFYVFGVLDFPHPGGLFTILLLGVLQVLAAQGFGIFVFSIMPSLRMSMSVCALWGVLSFSIAGSAFPVEAMDTPIQALSWLFPLRHYFMIYRTTVLNDFSLVDVWPHLLALVAFVVLPVLTLGKLKRAMENYVYIP